MLKHSFSLRQIAHSPPWNRTSRRSLPSSLWPSTQTPSCPTRSTVWNVFKIAKSYSCSQPCTFIPADLYRSLTHLLEGRQWSLPLPAHGLSHPHGLVWPSPPYRMCYRWQNLTLKTHSPPCAFALAHLRRSLTHLIEAGRHWGLFLPVRGPPNPQSLVIRLKQNTITNS